MKGICSGIVELPAPPIRRKEGGNAGTLDVYFSCVYIIEVCLTSYIDITEACTRESLHQPHNCRCSPSKKIYHKSMATPQHVTCMHGFS